MEMSPGRRPSQGTRPTSIRTSPTRTMSPPRTTSSRPRSPMRASLEEAHLTRRARGRLLTEVRVRVARRAPARRGSLDEADLQQVRLHHLGQRLAVVVDRGSNRLETDRSAGIVLDDGGKKAPIEPVEPARIDAFEVERGARHCFGYLTARLDLRVIPHATQQAVD